MNLPSIVFTHHQHYLSFPVDAFLKALPPGAMNFVSGRGRETMPPLMKTGDIDALAFIGGSSAADDLIGKHPHPHRLKVFLQLEAKNMGVSRVLHIWDARHSFFWYFATITLLTDICCGPCSFVESFCRSFFRIYSKKPRLPNCPTRWIKQ